MCTPPPPPPTKKIKNKIKEASCNVRVCAKNRSVAISYVGNVSLTVTGRNKNRLRSMLVKKVCDDRGSLQLCPVLQALC